jgi:hypothetical protein
MVEAWEPRTIGAAVMVNGQWQNRRMRGGHIAHVRSLRNGRRYRMSDAHLRHALDAEDW